MFPSHVESCALDLRVRIESDFALCSSYAHVPFVPLPNFFNMDPTPSPSIAWYCLKTQPKHEHIAGGHLRQMAGVTVFLPRLRFQKATKRGKKWFNEAMFPGYLFARFDYVERHKEVRYAMGVSAIVHFGGICPPIDDSVMETLMTLTGNEHVAVLTSEVKEGDSVKIVEGALHGLEAVVTQTLSGRERVRILLNFLGREVPAEVTTSGLLPEKRHPLTIRQK